MREIYIVERWVGHDAQEPEYNGVFCFDTRHEAEAFADRLTQDNSDEVGMVWATDLFVHSADAIKAARGE